MNKNKKIFIVIPAFNEAKMIRKVIKHVKKAGFENIIVVDDGSYDQTQAKALDEGVYAIKHLINRGKGAATQTGFDAAKALDADIVVTIDADGQHDPKEISLMIEPILKEEVDITLGSRLINSKNLPFTKRIANRIGNLITYAFYGIYVTDSQSGFRAYNKKAMQLINTTFDRYEFESEVLAEINKHKLTYKEVPINVRYTLYSQNRYLNIKGFERQRLMNGFKMIFRMLIKTLTT